jgi:dTDP-4-amino-4,6-dideoxygalactose transaminase
LLGANSRLDEIQAAVLTERLEWLDQFTARRQHIAGLYLEHINSAHVRHLSPPGAAENHVYHLFVVTTSHRAAFMDFLRDLDIESLIHYPVPAHHQKALPGITVDPEGLVVAEAHAETCVSLPCHPGLSDDDVVRVIDAVNAFSA